MKFERLYSALKNANQESKELEVFCTSEGEEYMLPKLWSDDAKEVFCERAFYRGAIPADLVLSDDENIPTFIQSGKPANDDLSYETSFVQVARRICGSITCKLYKSGIFDDAESAENFYLELEHMLYSRTFMFDLVMLSNMGINWAYGLEENLEFSQSISNFNVNNTNAFSRLKILSEDLGLAEGKREGITFPIENVDAEKFIDWKKQSEIDFAALSNSKNIITKAMHSIIDACDRDSIFGFDASKNSKLSAIIDAARAIGVGEEFINLAINYAEQGYEEVNLGAGNSVLSSDNVATNLSIPSIFIESALTEHSYLDDSGRHILAHETLDKIASAIWSSGEPAILFRDKVKSDSLVNIDYAASASGGFIFAPGVSAPTVSINAIALLGNPNDFIDIEKFEHVVRIATLSLSALSTDVSNFRPIVIGITNLAELLMSSAFAYDSDKGRTFACLICALLTGFSYKASIESAEKIGKFIKYAEHENKILQIIKDKCELLSGMAFTPNEIDFSLLRSTNIFKNVDTLWKDVYRKAQATGLSNAYFTAIDTSTEMQRFLGGASRNIAPLNSIFITEDSNFCSTKMNASVVKALTQLGYDETTIEDICISAIEEQNFISSAYLKPEHLNIFDTLSGIRRISYEAQLKMQAAVELFLSGAAVNYVVVSNHTSINEIKKLIIKAWEIGVKRLYLYREGSSLLSPAILQIGAEEINSNTEIEKSSEVLQQSADA